jgi:hypothetical protein
LPPTKTKRHLQKGAASFFIDRRTFARSSDVTCLYIVFAPEESKNDIQQRQSTMLPQAKAQWAKVLDE